MSPGASAFTITGYPSASAAATASSSVVTERSRQKTTPHASSARRDNAYGTGPTGASASARATSVGMVRGDDADDAGRRPARQSARHARTARSGLGSTATPA